MKGKLFVLAAVIGLMLTACGPGITVSNTTRIPVRVVVVKKGGSDVLSPSPGESSFTEAEEGVYRVTAVPDAEWIAYARATRQFLNDQLGNSDNLSGPQLLEVIRRLKEVASRMQEYDRAGNANAGCFGYVSEAQNGAATVALGANGALVVTCK